MFVIAPQKIDPRVLKMLGAFRADWPAEDQVVHASVQPPTPESLARGQALQQQRLSLQLELTDIARASRVRPRELVLLEGGFWQGPEADTLASILEGLYTQLLALLPRSGRLRHHYQSHQLHRSHQPYQPHQQHHHQTATTTTAPTAATAATTAPTTTATVATAAASTGTVDLAKITNLGELAGLARLTKLGRSAHTVRASRTNPTGPLPFNAAAVSGSWLRRRRQELGLSQRDLAKRAGISRSLIDAIERGQRQAKEARALLFRVLNVLEGRCQVVEDQPDQQAQAG